MSVKLTIDDLNDPLTDEDREKILNLPGNEGPALFLEVIERDRIRIKNQHAKVIHAIADARLAGRLRDPNEW